MFLDFAKTSLRLSSVGFVVLLFGLGVLLLCTRRGKRAGRVWLTTAVIVYPLLAMPVVATWFAGMLTRDYPPVATMADARGASVIVMLGGGITSYVAGDLALDDLSSSAPRVLETARVYRLLGNPTVIVSGGNTGKWEPPRPEAAAYRRALVQLGVPLDRVLVEADSMTTRDEAVIIKPMLDRLGATRFVLVTTPEHMRRSLAVFAHEGMDAVPSPSRPLADTTGRRGPFIPGREGLVTSDAAVYELLATGYYWIRGWVRRADFRY